MKANNLKVKPHPEFRSINKKSNIKKPKNIVLKTIHTFLVVFAIFFSGLHATKTNSFNPNVFPEAYAAKVGKTYWKFDEATGTLHLSGTWKFGYSLIYESYLESGYSIWDFNTQDVTTVEFDSEVAPTITKYWFSGFSNLTEIKNIERLNTSNVTDMEYMFYKCSSLTSLDLSSFDTSKATNMGFMFSNCSDLTNLDTSGFDTGKVMDMRSMFSGCSSLTNLDVSSFDTSKVKTMSFMFNSCSSLTNLDVGGFDTSKVTTMSGMFSDCSNLTKLDVSNFDTSKVTDMAAMFSGCSTITHLDVNGFDTSKVKNMSYMFKGCSSLTSLDLSSFDTSKATNTGNMLSNCSPASLSFSNSLILKLNPSFPSADYKHICSADGTYLDGSEILDLSTVMNNGFTAEEAATHAGTWVKPGASESHDLGDRNYEYVTIDDLWEKDGDVWTYTFNVFDDTRQYYAWEEYLDDYISINMANPDGTVSSPLVIDPALKSGTITNTSDNTGNLSISKTVEGAPASQADAKFTFHIALTGDKISGTQVFSDIVFKDGEAQIMLKDGESKVIENLPIRTTYTIIETQYPSYTVTCTGDTGVIEKGETAKAEFINTYTPEKPGQPGSLTIIKKVEGNYETLPNQKYKFIVNLEGLDLNANYIYSQGAFKSDADGKAIISIELEANEECVFLNLPEGTQYQVTEEAGNYKAAYTIQ